MKFTELNLIGGNSNIRYDKKRNALVYTKNGDNFSLENLKNAEITSAKPNLMAGYSYVIIGGGSNFVLPNNPNIGEYLKIFAKGDSAIIKTNNYSVDGDEEGIEIDANSGCGFVFDGNEWKLDEIKVNQVGGFSIGDAKQEFTDFVQDAKWGKVTVLNSTKNAMVSNYQYRAVSKVVLYMVANMGGNASISLFVDGVEKKEVQVNATSTIFVVEFELEKEIGLFSFQVKTPLVNSNTEQDMKIIGAEFYY
jgi:hypothetical protein